MYSQKLRLLLTIRTFDYSYHKLFAPWTVRTIDLSYHGSFGTLM